MRHSTKGRRRVEEDEFCRNCNRLKHDEKIMEQAVEIILLTAKIEDLEEDMNSILRIAQDS